MSDDVVFLVTGRAPMIGKAAFAAVMNASPAQGRPEMDFMSKIQEIQVLGDWAHLWTKLAVTIRPPGGATIARSGHTLSILKKINGRWLMAREANMLSSPGK